MMVSAIEDLLSPIRTASALFQSFRARKAGERSLARALSRGVIEPFSVFTH
jgi:hypothetical protein